VPLDAPALAQHRLNPSYSTNPDPVIQAAKIRAKAALNQPNPKLTALERAFYEKFKADQIIGIKQVSKGRYVVSTGASKKSQRIGRADADRPAA